MAQAEDKRVAKAKVPLKVSAPHVAVDANGTEPDDNQETNAKARKGALFLAAVVGLYVVYLVVTGQMGEFLVALSSVDMGWIAWASFAYIMYFVFGVVAYAIAVYLDHDSPVGIRDLMSVEASGVFFGNLTPMMAGAVPSQIFRLTRTGLDVGEASATQFTRFIMFQLGVVLFAAIMLAAKLQYFFDTYGDIIFLNLVVFGVHFLELALLFVVCLCPRFVMRVGNGAIRLATRHGWLKDPSHWDEVVNVQVMEFSGAFKRAAQDLPSMGLTLLVTMAQLACLYMIPWFVLKAFSIDADFLECLAAGSMVQMVASAVPLPGGTGGAEGGFLMFYGHMFGSAASAGFLVWRIVTFFGPTLLSAPLLGLRSKGGPSIYRRVQALIHGLPVRRGDARPSERRVATIKGGAISARLKSKGTTGAGDAQTKRKSGPTVTSSGIRVPMKKK
ncbi:MAG: flippase-like domain-containing protein [Olsenella sp.]|nr:flippase-like domain-containing protein [Olsenella sp.]